MAKEKHRRIDGPNSVLEHRGLIDLPTPWRFSWKWGSKVINCAPEGIPRCKGICCHGPHFWPARANKNDPTKCLYLSETGCIFDIKDRPITCLLFPFVLNSNNTLCLYGRATCWTCKGNYKIGNATITTTLYNHLYYLFGGMIYGRMVEAICTQRDIYFTPPQWVLESLKREKYLQEKNLIPSRRSMYGEDLR